MDGSGGRTAQAQACAAHLNTMGTIPCIPHARLCLRVPPRSDDIVRWIKKRTGPATVEVADAEALEKAQKENKVGGVAVCGLGMVA